MDVSLVISTNKFTYFRNQILTQEKIMKRITLLFFAFALYAGAVFSQSQRLVLAEEFTNASCGPCASQNPAFDALLSQNTDKITSIKYHMSWPGPDPMYTQNMVDNNARRAVYGISGVPHVHMDGSWWNGAPASVTQNRIDQAYAIPSPFEMQVHYELNDNDQVINVTTLVNVTGDVSGSNLRLFVVVIEKHIHFNSPPGYNGEKDFYNVMKKILPDKNGLKLKPSYTAGEYFISSDSWQLANVYNNDELSVVAFIQDMDTKEVFQAGNGSTDPIVPLYSNDVEISNIYYATTKNCSGNMTPKIKIRNNSSDEVTSMDIQYHINDGDTSIINWTGSLSFLDEEEIQLPQLNFPLKDTNDLVTEITSVNGGADGYTGNNVYDFEFYRADFLEEAAYLYIGLDDHPEETTWKLFNYEGDVVQEGGPYSIPNDIKLIELGFTSSSCYRLEMYDAGNNGFSGSGFYQVVYGTNSIAFGGTTFEDKDVNEITYDIVGIDEQTDDVSNLKVYPNPVSDKVTVSMTLSAANTVSVEVYDLLGKKVMNRDMGVQPAGAVDVSFDVNKLQTGVYLIKSNVGGQVNVNKVFVK